MRIDNLPEGWSDDPEELDYDYEWAEDDSIGQDMARDLGAERGRPVLFNTRYDVLLFEAGGKFFTWTRIGNSVSEIIAPTDLNEILDALRREGLRGVKTRKRW